MRKGASRPFRFLKPFRQPEEEGLLILLKRQGRHGLFNFLTSMEEFPARIPLPGEQRMQAIHSVTTGHQVLTV